jgi:hypothetical protein
MFFKMMPAFSVSFARHGQGFIALSTPLRHGGYWRLRRRYASFVSRATECLPYAGLRNGDLRRITKERRRDMPPRRHTPRR